MTPVEAILAEPASGPLGLSPDQFGLLRPLVVLLAMFALGTAIEAWLRRRPARRDRLNLLYAPFFIVPEIALGLAGFLAVDALRRHLGLDHAVAIGFAPPAFEFLEVLVFLFILDGVLYLMHRLQHAVPVLWAGHRLHHCDRHVDVTTTTRIHLLDQILRVAMVSGTFGLVVAPPHLTSPYWMFIPLVWIYYIHLNIDVGHGRLWWLATSPRYHLLHHEKIERGTGCNFAAFFPVWDIIGRTAETRPQVAPLRLGTGGPAPRTVRDMLAAPLAEALAGITRRGGAATRRRATPLDPAAGRPPDRYCNRPWASRQSRSRW